MDARMPNESLATASKDAPPTLEDAERSSMLVNAPVAQVYQRWLNGEDFPKFITAITASRRLDANHFAIVEQLNGERRDSVLEFVSSVPERTLVWRSMSDQLAAGVVTFTPRANGVTLVGLSMMSTYGGDVSQRVRTYLRNFKEVIENEPGERAPNGLQSDLSRR